MQEQIQKDVIKIIEDQLGVGPWDIEPDTRFVEDLGMDSLDALELMMKVEEKFNIKIDDSEKITTVGELVTYVDNCIQKYGIME